MAEASKNVSKVPLEHFQDEKLQWLVDFLEKPYFKPCLLHMINNAEIPSFPINKFCVDCKTPVCAKCITEFDHVDHAIIQVYRHVYQDAVTVKSIKTFMNINDIQTYKCNQILVVALRPLLSISEVNKKADTYLADTKLSGSPSRASNKTGCTKIIISELASTSSLYKKSNQSERICQICGRRLLPMHKFLYCSIQCKVIDYMNKSDDSMEPFLMPEMKPVEEVPDNVKIDDEKESYVIMSVEEKDQSSNVVEDENNVKVDEGEKIARQIARRLKRKGIPHRAPFF